MNELIEVAVADETAEVDSIDADAARLLSAARAHQPDARFIAILATLGLAAAACCNVCGRHSRSSTARHPALAEGDLSHRIAISGRDEFAQSARASIAWPTTCRGISRRLQDAHANLEAIVAERTEELRRANVVLAQDRRDAPGLLRRYQSRVRTPLTVIRGEGEIALRGRNKPVAEYKNSIARIVEQAKHLSLLVNDLLFIARQGAGAARLNLQSIDLGGLLEKVCGDAKVIAHAKAVDISYSNDEAQDFVKGDPARLRQLFMVLLDNAVRYSNTKGEVTVDVANAGDEVRVSVSDRGIGIAPEEIEGIFERFRRGGNAAEHNQEGLGLGLPVAKAIVEAHKGKIEMSSRLGEGTTVTVALPAAPPEAVN